MDVKIKLLKSWEHEGELFAKGEVLEVDTDTAKMLLDDDIAEKHRVVKSTAPTADPEATPPTDNLDTVVKAAISEAMAALTPENKRMVIEGGKMACEDAPNGGFDHRWQFYKAIHTAEVSNGHVMDDRLLCRKSLVQKTAGEMETGDGALGGYGIPTAFFEEMLTNPPAGGVGNQGEILRRCRKIPLQVNSIEIPFIDESSRVDGSRGGAMASKPQAEGGSLTKSSIKEGQLTLTLHDITAYTIINNQLFEDSPMSIPALVEPQFRGEIVFKQENQVYRGTGGGQARGFITDSARVTVAKETGQTALNIVAKNLSKMYARMLISSLGNAVWLYNQAVFPQLHDMTVNTGTAGTPVMLPGNTMSTAPFGTILGRPMFPVEYASALGTEGDIVFVDLNEYLLAHKANGIQSAMSGHVLFDKNQSALRWVVRQDGQLWRRTALTPANGTDTVSSIVTLASDA